MRPVRPGERTGFDAVERSKTARSSLAAIHGEFGSGIVSVAGQGIPLATGFVLADFYVHGGHREGVTI